MAVLAAAAARGWQLADVRVGDRLRSLEGPGRAVRAALRARPDGPAPALRMAKSDRLRDPGRKTCADGTLATSPHAPLQPNRHLAAEYGLIRQWLTAILCAAEDPERVKGWGGRAIAVRLVLLALGQAAMVSGSSMIEFGTRNLALHSALSHRTVARVLRMLRDEPDPLIDLVITAADGPGRPLRRSGSRTGTRTASGGGGGELAAIEAAHPAFLVLGGTAALVYQVLDQARARGAEVARAARLSPPRPTSAALRVARRARARRARPGRLAPRCRRPGRRRRVDRRGRPAAGAGGAVPAGPGKLAGPAPAVPGRPPPARDERDGWWSAGRRGRVRLHGLPLAGAER